MHRYVVFTYYVGRALGGMNDFLDSFDSVDEALDNLLKERDRYFQIVQRYYEGNGQKRIAFVVTLHDFEGLLRKNVGNKQTFDGLPGAEPDGIAERSTNQRTRRANQSEPEGFAWRPSTKGH